MKKVVLSKLYGWVILIGLVFLDAILDVIFAKGKGLESPIWKPVANFFGVSNPLWFVPIVLLAIFVVVKFASFLSEKIDKVSCAEELTLTAFVIIYGIFDLWLILVYTLNFSLFKNHYQLIPILIAVGIIYELWAERELKKK